MSWYRELRATTLQAAVWNSSREKEREMERETERESAVKSDDSLELFV